MSNNNDDFELSDDSDCEYEANRRLRRMLPYQYRRESTHVLSESSSESAVQSSIAGITNNNILVTTTFSLNYDDAHGYDPMYSKKCNLKQTTASTSLEVVQLSLEGASNTVLDTASKLLHLIKRVKRTNWCWQKNSSKCRLELWLIIPCITTLFFILFLDSATSDKFVIRDQEDGLQHYNAARTRIKHEHLDDKFGNHYHDLADLYTPLKNDDIPLLWSVPFGGTDVLEDIVMNCYGNRTVTGVEVLTDISRIMDMDVVAAREGIERIQETIPNPIFISSSLPFISSFFTPETRGRIFTVLRNPIDRTVDQYYDQYREAASQMAFASDDNDASILILSLEEYLSSFDGRSQYYFVDNWLIRTLTDRIEPTIGRDYVVDNKNRRTVLPDLRDEHLEHAKQILRQKVLVGVFDEIDEFVDWLELFFSWEYKEEGISYDGHTQSQDTNIDKVKTCRNLITEEYSHKKLILSQSNRYPVPGSDIYNAILEKNKWDMELYWYVKNYLYDDELGMINFIFRRQQRPMSEDVRDGG